MERNIEKKLVAWKDSEDRKPLILIGARQVGKTWMLQEFGKRYFKNTVVCNFDKDKEIGQLFVNKSPDRIVSNLELMTGRKIVPNKTLLIFDEIQQCPDALNSLKYFFEDMRELHVAAAGSLLGILLAKHSYPVGAVDLIDMNPMDFDEYLKAVDPVLHEAFFQQPLAEPIADVFHTKLTDAYHQYLIVGGMPECVADWAKKRDPASLLKKQKALIRFYEGDFGKHSETVNAAKCLQVFQSIPAQLAKENEKFIYGAVRKGARAKELEHRLGVDKGVKSFYGTYSLAPAREASEQWMADSFLANLDRVFKATKRVETDKILRDETLRDGTFAGSYLRRAASAGDLGKMKEILLAGIRETDPATEKELLEYALSEFFTNMDDYYMGDFQRWIQDRFGYDYDAAAEYLWKGSLLSSQSKIQEMEDPSEINGDLLLKFLNDSPLSLYNGRAGHRAALDQIGSLSQEYVRKIYDDGLRRGVPVYPDANSTVRFTYGTIADSYSTPAEYLALLDPKDPERDLGPNLKALMMKDFWGRWGFKVGGKKHRMVIDFISDNDFVDGCQGSPVLDNQGHLIGVVSGGTPETRAGSDFYKEGSSKCVSTDIHFVLWYLGKGIELKRIVKEFEIL